jgi:hypothetical protein
MSVVTFGRLAGAVLDIPTPANAPVGQSFVSRRQCATVEP